MADATLELTADTDAVVALRGIVGYARKQAVCDACGRLIDHGDLTEYPAPGVAMHVNCDRPPDPDPHAEAAPDAIAAAEDLVALGQALEGLGERDAYVLTARYGLGGAMPLTLEDVGQRLGVTRERARQVQRDAEGRLRSLLTAPDAPAPAPGPPLPEQVLGPAPTAFELEALVPDWLAA
jgi:sigma-70-like protein